MERSSRDTPIQIPHLGPSLSTFSKHTLQVNYIKLNWGAVPPIYLHTISENVRALFEVPLSGTSEEIFCHIPLGEVSVSPICFCRSHEFCSTDTDLFQHLELGTYVKYLNVLQTDFGNLSMGIGGW